MNDTATLLVVDDDADLRELVMYAIQDKGIVVEAENGREALEYIENHGVPALILLDMNMPVMNGWEFARELRARGLWLAPVIVLTAAHDAERSSNEIGAAGFLGKPFSVATLASTVELHLRKRRFAVRDDEHLPDASKRTP
jgi:DNA-binding response OmpR family regulator